MKALYFKSQQRLKTVMANKPRYIHTAYNIETLRTSPLMCFPHFEEMTDFLSRWFDTEAKRQSEAKTTTQIATFDAQKRFCKGLFLLMQETARASPLSVGPLKGIYNWYLQRDSVINQSRAIDKNTADEGYYVVEMINGKKIRVSKDCFDFDTIINKAIYSQEQMDAIIQSIQPDTPEEVDEMTKKPNRRKVTLVTETFPKRTMKKTTPSFEYDTKFDYDAFHAYMEEQRQAERDTDRIAQKEANKRRHDILQRVGWE
ncbi:hypothetical protein TRFO_07154 [Tritrichomonas foetus]|uniref:Uncharacterized protein n=1 Tax=Tritrichomonas foetus TaxID=1144522 RepID=A0A1J4JUE6_9EUKA|nr:hypothetical protein TRFO_07154 [Tritrichomonas foetus]|eukprot:OHT02330.1 hypothetical protein TRFO_07154 [Tritrichomonas foetus]